MGGRYMYLILHYLNSDYLLRKTSATTYDMNLLPSMIFFEYVQPYSHVVDIIF